MKRIHLFFHKLFHWEYWPFHIVYIPCYFAWMYFAIRSRCLFFFLPANPSIKNAGFLLESKKEIYDILPAGYYPATILVPAGTSTEFIPAKMNEAGIRFPCIAKPDIGMKGLGVACIENMDELEAYTSKAPISFLLQEYINWPNEIGVFYYRMPGNERGHISGIVHKEFLTVTGDGHSSIETLLHQNPRHLLQLPIISKKYGNDLKKVLNKGEIMNLVPYGNHARGARFTNATVLADKELLIFFDTVCRQIPSFYYGRLDIRYNTIEELKQGKHFSIIELNGAGSEPTHIYDPGNSIFFAWKEIIRHYKILSEISRRNHAKGHPHMNWREGLKMLKENGVVVKQLQSFSKSLSLK